MTIRSMLTTDKYRKNYDSINWSGTDYVPPEIKKKAHTHNIIPDNYDAKSFVTANINGKPIEIESRSQERRLLKQHGLIKREKGMKKDDKRIRYKNEHRIDGKGLGFEWDSRLKK